jgi:sensor histidine kinase regulating citrate/malate metabolism
MPKYISMVLNQIVLWIVFQFIVKLIRQNMLGFHAGYTVLVISMSVISVFTVVVLQHLVEGRNEQYKLFYTCAVVVGIILLLTVSLIMYGINERNHIEKLQQEMEISAYRRQKHDVKEITRNYQEMENVRHEMNKVIVTTSRLLQDGKYAEAQKFIEQFQTEENDRVRKVYYTDNIILNYLLNQKIEVCQKRNIHMKYIINGVIDGIKDIDLHCIVSNLLDNAIEATQKLDNKNISFSIFGNPYSIYIEVSNTVAENVLQCNPKLQSSKTEGHHGYGIKNVRATVEKYQGEIRYRQKLEGYLTCEVVMMKNFTTETGNSRQDN